MKDTVVKEEIRMCLLAAIIVPYTDASFNCSLCLAKSHADNVCWCKVVFVLLNEALCLASTVLMNTLSRTLPHISNTWLWGICRSYSCITVLSSLPPFPACLLSSSSSSPTASFSFGVSLPLCWHQRGAQPEINACVNHHLLRIKWSPTTLTIHVQKGALSIHKHCTEHLHG